LVIVPPFPSGFCASIFACIAFIDSSEACSVYVRTESSRASESLVTFLFFCAGAVMPIKRNRKVNGTSNAFTGSVLVTRN
jgi:hypothetical protein